MSRYRFIEAESRRYSVTQLCRIAQVSRTAYYEWQDGPSERERDDAALTAKIRAIHAESDGQYGVPRVLVELRAQGHDVGRKRVAVCFDCSRYPAHLHLEVHLGEASILAGGLNGGGSLDRLAERLDGHAWRGCDVLAGGGRGGISGIRHHLPRSLIFP